LYDISRVLLSLCIYIFTTFIHMVLPRLCAKRQKSSSSPLFLVSHYISIIRVPVPGTILLLLLLLVIILVISLFLQINSIFRWVFLPHLFQTSRQRVARYITPSIVRPPQPSGSSKVFSLLNSTSSTNPHQRSSSTLPIARFSLFCNRCKPCWPKNCVPLCNTSCTSRRRGLSWICTNQPSSSFARRTRRIVYSRASTSPCCNS